MLRATDSIRRVNGIPPSIAHNSGAAALLVAKHRSIPGKNTHKISVISSDLARSNCAYSAH